MIVSAVVLSASALGVWTLRPWMLSPAATGDELTDLLIAENVRPTEGRLSGLPFLARAVSARGPSSSSTMVQLAARRRLARFASRPDASDGALALSYASLQEWDRAVDALEDAVDRKLGSADVFNDLSAMYLARAASEARTEDVPRALAFAERAIKANPSSREPWFNRALALEALHLRDAADQAWKDYLSRETEAPWAAEARRLRSRLAIAAAPDWKTRQASVLGALANPETRTSAEAELRREYAQAVRETIENDLLPGWAGDVLANRSNEAAGKLSMARTLAGALARAGGDPIWDDVIRCIDRAETSGDVHRMARLAGAHASFARGTRIYLEGRIHDAIVEFSRASGTLRAEGSPLALWIQAYHALDLRAAGARQEALRLLRSGGLASKRGRYGVLDGRAGWFEGNIAGELGRPDEAISAFRRAHAAFLAVGERAYAGDAEGLVADQLSYLGRFAEAWTFQLSAVDRYWRARGRHSRVAMTSGTFLALANGTPEVALHFQNAAIQLIAPTQQVAYPDAHLFRARVRARLGMAQETREDLDEAQRALDRMVDPGMKQWMRAQMQWVRAEAAAALETSASTVATAEAAQFYRQGGFPFESVRVLRTSARLHLSASRIDAAERDLAGAIEEFERQRASIRDELLRVTPFEEGALAFDDMIRLQTRQRGRWDLAFRYAERGRAGSVRGVVRSPLSAPPDHASLPAGVVLLYYVALEDRLLVFGMTTTEFRWGERAVGRSELAVRLRRLRALAATGELESLRPVLREWYDDVVSPVADLITKDATVAVVLDGLLNNTPFAALVQPSGRFLIEDHAIVRASNLASLIDATNAWARRRSPLRRALVAAPAATVDGTRRLAPLPAARAEATAIGEYYPAATVLLGSQATRQAFEAQLADADVIHFAGHAVANQRFPLLSRLLFTASGDQPSALSAFELERLSLTRTRVVTLAACEAAGGLFVRGEGTLSLARPWLRAGAPSVVASIWDLDDASARSLFTSLHALIAGGTHPANALQRVQLDAIRGGRIPFRDWAGLAMFGAAPL
jgi:CHAT domain-containing protein/tetratricopeptide (TPR) repeat protein